MPGSHQAPIIRIPMDLDLTDILSDWPYEPGQINVRLIQGKDEQRKIQVRLDLGILQMNTEGRPDGLRPKGFDSLLDFHQSRIDALEAGDIDPEDDDAIDADLGPEGEAGEDAGPFVLTEEECRALREETAQYYHRYVALLVLEEYQGVIRDTTRNLRVLDLCRKHAQTEADRTALEQFRPYILMMRARAMASQAVADNEPKAAVAAIDEGLDVLRAYFTEIGQADQYEESAEVQMLRGMREALIPKLPVSQGAELKERLRQAVESENYELAAILRDELKMLRDRPPQA